MTENTPSEALKLWRDALTAFHLGKFGHDDQAAAAIIDAALAERHAEIARLREALRDMADVVAVYALQPPHPTRQRDPIAQAQWDQIAAATGEMLRAALGSAKV